MEPSDDLSDVIPIGVTIAITDGVNEMKFGKRICEIQGYGENGWTTDQMLDYFQDLCRVYDAWAESKSAWVLPDYWHDLEMPDEVRNASGLNAWAVVRDFVAKCYEKYADKSMVEILYKLRIQPDEWRNIVSANKGRDRIPSINMEHVAIMETYFTALVPPYDMNELSEKVGLGRRTLETMRKQFAKRRIAIHGEEALRHDRAPALLRHLIAQGDLRNNEVLDEVEKQTGIRFSKSYVSKVRNRPEQPRKKKKP
jgi:hypothetical protein